MNSRVVLTLLVAGGALSDCSSGPLCDARSCVTGCCDSLGACVQTPHALACGTQGQACQACAGGQACLLGACVGASGTGGGAGGGEGGGSGGGTTPATSCSGSLQRCLGECVDRQADENNCGFCGNSCASGQVCDRGSCRLLPMDCSSNACPPGFGCSPTTHKCEPGCQVSADCPTGSACVSNQCQCPAQQHACGQQCVANADRKSVV